ncbi:hypothetical protein [Paraliomyxa miuraensis]|uniref:hypothetical protein n=1 Tax=Paraliomyxa miuraensis TaxID=376150 RepID=UPI00224CC419|nr:hypothetical protein [Paraliomyxa miuraensis]MCX4247306.1 hypothetical protein [Paraliomyxa miuraensis]
MHGVGDPFVVIARLRPTDLGLGCWFDELGWSEGIGLLPVSCDVVDAERLPQELA